MWRLITTERFDKWFRQQQDALQDEILAAFIVLQQKGPATGEYA